jgi:hypothetical protein
MNEYSVPNSKTLVDFDFDENKVTTVGALSVSVTPSIPNYKTFQESWRIKGFQV